MQIKVKKVAPLVAIAVLIIVSMMFFMSTTSIDSGEAGVLVSKYTGTYLDTYIDEGLNFHPLWVDSVVYDVRVKVADNTIPAQTSDGNDIRIDISLQFRPSKPDLAKLHQKYGPGYADTLVNPVIRSVTRQVSSNYNPEELYASKRREFQKEIFEEIKSALENECIIVQEVLVRDIDLGSLKDSIAKKVSAQQELEREIIENKRRKIEAEGRSVYQRTISEFLTPEYIKFKALENEERRIQALKELAASPNAKVVFVPTTSEVTTMVNTDSGGNR